MWGTLGIAAGVLAAYASYWLALEVLADSLMDWRDDFDDKIQPLRNAYRAHLWVRLQQDSVKQERGES